MPFDTSDPDTLPANRREIFAELCGMLPPSVAATPDLRAKRDERAMAAVVALHPDDDFEARLALRIVAMDATPPIASASPASPSTTPRRSAAAAPRPPRWRASRMRRCARCCASRPPARSRWRTSIPPPWSAPAIGSRRSCRPTAPQPSAAARSDAEPERTEAEIDAEAELYVVMYPDRVERIRAAGGLPARLDFGAPGPEIVARLLRSAGRSAAGTRAGR